MTDIFISYSREDRPRIERLAAALAEKGFDVWWDRNLTAGTQFSKETEAKLRDAKLILVAWSKASIDSMWVADEASVGRDRRNLIPIAIDDVEPPIGFRQIQTMGFSDWKGDRSAVELIELVAALRARTPESPVPSPKIGRASWREQFLQPLPIAAALTVIIAAIAGWFLVAHSGNAVSHVAAVNAAPRIVIAPFEAAGGDAVLSANARSLRDNIVAGLSRFSTFAVASSSDENGTRYRLEGTLQQAGDTLRLTARLTDTQTGEQIWSERFDQPTENRQILAIQDDLTDYLVASVADPYGALMRNLQAPVAAKDPASLTPYEAVVRHAIYRQRLSVEDHLATRDALERAAVEAPNNADVFAALAAITIEEIKHGYNVKADSGDRALKAAQRAMTIDRNNAYANFELAEVQYFRRNNDAFKAAAERAIELNPRDTEMLAMLGILTAYAGDWDRGTELTSRAKALNPNHPGWYNFAEFFNSYRMKDYDRALEFAQHINQPDYFPDAYARAAVYGQLGRSAEAQAAASQFLNLWPFRLDQFVEMDLETWFYAQPSLIAQIVDGLHKAGLEIELGAAAPVSEKSVAVLPFVDMSASQDQEYFADGVSEEILNVLVRIPNLKVAGRTSSFSFKNKNDDLRKIGGSLGVNHVLEGSVRKSGDKLRITAQLVRTQDGFHVWSQTYDRELTDIFEIQDDIAKSVARALAISFGLNVKNIATGRTNNIEDYEDYLRARKLILLRGQKNLDAALLLLNDVTARAPDFAPAWVQIAYVYSVYESYLPLRGGLAPEGDWRRWRAIGRAAAERALSLDAQNAEAQIYLAMFRYYEADYAEAAKAVDRAVELAPENPAVLDSAAQMFYDLGYFKEARKYAERAIAIDPLVAVYENSLGNILWYGHNAFDETGAIAEAQRHLRRAIALEPELIWPNLNLVWLLVDQRKFDMARQAISSGADAGAFPAELAGVLREIVGASEKDDGSLRALARGVVPMRDAMIGRQIGDSELIVRAMTPAWEDEYRFDPQLMRFPGSGVYGNVKWKEQVRTSGVLALWRARGFPSWCKPKPDGMDDFECVE